MPVTHDSVIDAFIDTQHKMEGWVNWMYLDQLGLVTTGMGNLIDPLGAALALPWTHGIGGTPATQAEVTAAWTTVKNAFNMHPELRQSSGYSPIYGQLTDLRISDDAIHDLVKRKFLENETVLVSRIPTFGHLTADAQMGIHSLAWAAGPHFDAPKFMAAITLPVPDYDTAQVESQFRTINAQRNAFNHALFGNASLVQKLGGDIERLFYPTLLTAENAVLEFGRQAAAVASFQKGAGLGALFYVGLGALGYGALKLLQMRS